MFAIPIINSNRVIYHFASKYVYEASKLYITTGFINQRERERELQRYMAGTKIPQSAVVSHSLLTRI
jgi:hypothetical protein